MLIIELTLDNISKYHANMKNRTVTRSRHFSAGQNMSNWTKFDQRTGQNMSKQIVRLEARFGKSPIHYRYVT
jgi:hypothetical protein